MIELGNAIELAVNAHAGQRDEQNKPYILHLVRVMKAVICQVPDDNEAHMVAVLYDLIEDAGYEAEDLRKLGYSDRVIEALQAISRKKHESYEFYIECVGRNKLARLVKIVDLRDNLGRISGLSEKDQDRLRPRYLKALRYLVDLEE